LERMRALPARQRAAMPCATRAISPMRDRRGHRVLGGGGPGTTSAPACDGLREVLGLEAGTRDE
jgi:hypothetical protein